jgi:DNA-binding transcriptional LysR family regulator
MQALRLFCDVAALRSFSQAAERHSITQSAVSQRMRQFEELMGVTLLDRSVRPCGLTPAGELLAREGRELLDRYDDLSQRITELNGGPQLIGSIRVDAIYSAGIGLLKKLREQFQAQEPGVSVTLDYKRPERVADAVLNGECDLGIVSYPRTWKGVGVRDLRDEPMCLVSSRGHELTSNGTVHASQLGNIPMIGFEPDLPVSRAITRYLRSNGVRRRYDSLVDNIDTMKSMIAETDQVAILPRRTVEREASNGSLSLAQLEPQLDRPLGVIFRRHSKLAPATRAFLDFLVQHAGPAAKSAA